MIKKTDKLFDFIQAMTSHERGYFKQSSNKDSYYVILFDAMCKQKDYNEGELVKQLKRAGCNRKISAMKDYLWRELTQAMAPYHLIKTPLGEATAQMQRLQLLQDKGLSNHINKDLHALKKFCLKYELYDTLLQTLQFEFRFGFHQLSLNDNYWQEFHEAVHANMVYMQLSEIQHRLHLYVLKRPNGNLSEKEAEEVNSLINHSVLTDKLLENMIRLQLIREAIYDLYAHLKNNYRGIVKHNMNIVALLEDRPHLIKDGREISLIYTNIVIALANAGQRKELANVVDEIIVKLHNIPHHQQYSLGRELEVKVLRMLTLNNFKPLPELIEAFRDRLYKIPVSIKHHLYYNIALAYVKSGAIDAALDWIDEAISFYRTHKRADDTNPRTLRVLHILIHFELRNYVYVINQVESFMRTYKPVLKDKDQNYVVLKYLRSAAKSVQPEKEMKKLRDKLYKDFSSTSNSILLDMHLWVDCIAEGKTYANACASIAKQQLN